MSDTKELPSAADPAVIASVPPLPPAPMLQIKPDAAPVQSAQEKAAPVESPPPATAAMPAPAAPDQPSPGGAAPDRANRKPSARPAANARPMNSGLVAAQAAIRRQESPRQSRFILLAASVAIAACIGATIGSLATSALTHLATPAPLPPRAEASDDIGALKETVAQLKSSLKTLGDQMAGLRVNVDSTMKVTNAQLTRISDNLDRVERGQAEPAAKLVKLIENLEHRAIATAPSPEVTGTIPQTQAAPPPKPVIPDVVVRRVYDGVAVIQSRRGIAEVVPGDDLPGAGRIQEIKRENGRWVVVTSKGLILSR
jgi:hypothetical protein